MKQRDVQVAVIDYFESLLEESFFKTTVMASETRWKKYIELGSDYVEK